MADNVSLKIWNAIEPLVNRKIEEQTRNCQRMKSMTVSTAYNAQTGVVGVTEAFGKEIFLPVISTIDAGKLTVGANVWVSMPYSSMSNAIVVMMGDGDNGNMAATAEMTAGELSAKTADEKTAFYNSGIRLLKVVNGDTVVLLGLQSDGSTAWLGSNQPANNLLDNSDFTNPVNQRGATIVTDGYSIDRWRNWAANSSSITVNNNSISVVGTLLQYVANIKPGSVLTFAYGNESKTVISSNWGINPENNVAYFNIETGTWTWAAVYRGAYTADTLPPYVPKGYAAELAECMRYAVALPNQMRIRAATISYNTLEVFVPLPMLMRSGGFPTISTADFAVVTMSGDVQSGFAFSIIQIGTNGFTLRGTKANHGLSDADVRTTALTIVSRDL